MLTKLVKPTNPLNDDSFFPDWDCFACRNTGWIAANLVRLIDGYEQYNSNEYKNVTCSCHHGAHWRHSQASSSFDNSFTPAIRAVLHEFSRKDWIETNKAIAAGNSKVPEVRQKLDAALKAL